MKYKISVVSLCLALAGSAPVNGEVLSANYNINDGGALAANFPFSGLAVTSATHDVTIGGPVVGTVGFAFSGQQLSITIDPSGAAFGVPIDWTFSGLTFTSGGALTGLTYQGGTASTSTPTFSTNGADSISITTAADLGDPATYNFAFTDTFSVGAAAVPEPSSIAFLMLGGAGFWFKRRRQVA